MFVALVSLCAAAFAAPTGEIAFVGAFGSNPSRVYILTVATNSLRAIGPDNALGAPAWSPDGRHMAFTAQTPSGTGVYVTDADGTLGHFLAHAQPNNTNPLWSPDGTQLAYTAGAGLDARVMVATLSTGDEVAWGGGRTSLMAPAWTTHRVLDRLFERLADDLRPGLLASIPSLSSSSNSPPLLLAIGFVGDAAKRTTGLFVLSESEAAPVDTDLMPSPGAYEEGAISVSAQGFAFDSNDGGDREIFVIGRRMTWDASNHAAADWQPLWSPDARWLAFESFRGGTRGIYRCHKESTRVSKIVAGPTADCWGAAWAPNSEWLAFTTNAGGAPSLWIVGADGKDRVRISPLGMSAGYAAWRPAL